MNNSSKQQPRAARQAHRGLTRLALAAALVAPTRQARGQTLIDAKSAAVLRDQYVADLDTVRVKIMRAGP